jgi:hypothetical protein
VYTKRVLCTLTIAQLISALNESIYLDSKEEEEWGGRRRNFSIPFE